MSCHGGCCAVFTISAENLQKLRVSAHPSAHFILDMLIPVPVEELVDRLVRLGYSEGHDPATYPDYARSHGYPEEWQTFTCRHWDETSRLCAVYDERPTMCRKYPNGQTCQGCGWKAAETLPQIDRAAALTDTLSRTGVQDGD